MNLKSAIPFVAKLFGVNLLSKEATINKLRDSKLFYEEGETLALPSLKSTAEIPAEYQSEQKVNSYGLGVFVIPGGKKVKILNYGGIKWGSDVLNLDFGCSLFIKTLIQRDKRPVIDAENCIPLWSHFWGNGYYDYMFFVYAKFLRIASVLNKEQLANIKITYPLVNTAFEKELWALAGIADDQLIDSRKYQLRAKNYYVANTQSWYYQHKTDIELLQQTIRHVEIGEKPGDQFIYISRKARRKVTNEDELIIVLKELNFTIVEDKQRSVAEQMAIFNNARVIVGPHGAAFTNILWCKPGTHLVELFPKNYYPPYFRALAASLSLNYTAIFEQGIQGTHFSNMGADVTIDPQIVKNTLKELIATL